ncbi:MAG: RNA polymerase sigma factor [Sphingorhabdus sp.]|uniref:RNA polymerase sigma factor n=1 Tax=Sphingorhabdus sp. TaxID=1902408 RepID=UPI003CC3F811
MAESQTQKAKTAHRAAGVAIIAAARSGSPAAFEALARHWHVRLVAHGLRLTQDREMAADAAQAAWLDIAKGLRGLRDDQAFAAWAYRIVTRRCANIIRQRQGQRDLTAEMLAEPVTEASTEQYVEGNDSFALQRAIAMLPPGQRAALALHYYEDLSIAEVAVALAIPAGTVKTRLMHARNQLRHLLEGAKI